MQPLKSIIFSLFYSTILWFSAYAAPFARPANNNVTPQNYFLSNYNYGMTEAFDQRQMEKRVHHLSLLRMGKLFKPNASSSQVKRMEAESLWRQLAVANSIRSS